MKSGVFKCPFCYCNYNEGTNKPLSLPCGHVYCLKCVKLPEFICPSDKIRLNIDSSELPCCYAIMANLPKETEFVLGCKKHVNKKIKYYCEKHREYLCTDCVIDHTGAGHSITSFKPDYDALKKKTISNQNQITEISNSLNGSEVIFRDVSNKLNESFSTQETYITKAYDFATKTLSENKFQLHEKCKQFYDDQKRSILSQLAQCTTVTEKLNKYNEIYAKLCTGQIKYDDDQII